MRLPRRCAAGFTLIELLAVLAILALTALLVIPRLPAAQSSSLRSSARNLAAALRYTQDQAIVRKTPYRLTVDLRAGTCALLQVTEAGEGVTPADPFFSRQLLADGITVSGALVANLGAVSAGEVTVPIGPGGLSELLAVYLQNGRGEQFTVMAFPQGGRVTVVAGRQESALL